MSTGLSTILPTDALPQLVGVGTAPAGAGTLAVIPNVSGLYAITTFTGSPADFSVTMWACVRDDVTPASSAFAPLLAGNVAATNLGLSANTLITATYGGGPDNWALAYAAATGPISFKIVRLA